MSSNRIGARTAVQPTASCGCGAVAPGSLVDEEEVANQNIEA